jgi:putative OPT family oligopeptide transporter
MNTNNSPVIPFISAEQNLPEMTFKAMVLAILLVIVLTAANAYLGLKIGITISASIPAAVVSMGALRLFRQSNILENNIVQTAASAGEAIAAGIIYILPALVIIHYWQNFNYQETLWISLIGGILGVLFSVPVRRILLSHKELRFPEGTAIGQVLKASVDNKGGLRHLIIGGIVGGAISLCQNGFQILSSSLQFWQRTSQGLIYGFDVGLDPALLAAGYIVGVGVAASALIGVVLGWVIGVPLLSHFYSIPGGDAGDAAIALWRNHIRYIGVGTMLTAGFWTLFTLIKPITAGIRTSFASAKMIRREGHRSIPRTERDIPIHYVLWITLVLCIPLSFLLYHYANNPVLNLGLSLKLATIVISLLFIIFIGFIFIVLGAYFAGLVGSTNSPTSALSLATLILIALIMLTLLGPFIHFSAHPEKTLIAIALVLMITTVLSVASISNETIQDLKAGQIVGATPWKQQVMLIIGVIIASFLIPLILQLLFDAYGIGGVFPRSGMNPAHMLAAPQAGMMATLAQGVFSYNLPWSMMSIGVIIGVLCIIADRLLRGHGYSLSLLAVGFGIYLPLDAIMPFVIGGFAAYFIDRAQRKRHANNSDAIKQGEQRGITLACGIVAGAALMGVILAIPFAIAESTDILKLASDNFTPIANILSVLVTAAVLFGIYRAVRQVK